MTVYGTARSLNISVDDHLIPVRETFTGDDCMHKLVQYLLDSGFIMDLNNKTQAQNYLIH